MSAREEPALLILNQMAGPMTWELAEDAGEALGCVALLTGHPDTLQKSHDKVLLYPAAPYQRGGFARRALSWIHYWWQAFFWLWRWPRQTPLLLFSNPPLLCWLGWLMRRLRGQRYSVMVHDIYPDVLVRMSGYSETHPLIRVWRWLNRRAYENADVVMTLGEYMAANLERQFDSTQTRSGRVEVVYPWVDTDVIKPIPKDENWFARKYDQVDKLTVMYSGNMGVGHDIETMLVVAERLQRIPEIHFMFIGAGPKWKFVDEWIRQHGLNNITLLPWQYEENLPGQLAAADIGLVSLEDDIQGLAVPSKTFYMMAAGAALLSLSSPLSEVATIVSQYRCGTNVVPGDIDGFESSLRFFTFNREYLSGCQHQAQIASTLVFARKHNTGLVVEFALDQNSNQMSLSDRSII